MAIITYPLDNVDYSAEGAEIFHCTRTSGVFASDLDYPVTCSGADNNVTVGQGMAWIRNARFAGKAVAHKESTVLDAGLADPTYPRIDAVVLQFSAAQNATNLIIKKGRAQSNPQPPEVVRTESVYELHLCHIYRKPGAVSITQDDLTDLRENEKFCGIMYDDVTMKGTLQFLTQADKGAAGGVASLDKRKRIPDSQVGRGKNDGVCELIDGKILENRLPEKRWVTIYSKDFQESELPSQGGYKPITRLEIHAMQYDKIVQLSVGVIFKEGRSSGYPVKLPAGSLPNIYDDGVDFSIGKVFFEGDKFAGSVAMRSDEMNTLYFAAFDPAASRFYDAHFVYACE